MSNAIIIITPIIPPAAEHGPAPWWLLAVVIASGLFTLAVVVWAVVDEIRDSRKCKGGKRV